MSWEVAAIVGCLTMLGWLVLTEWVPLSPLNDLEASTPGERIRAAAGNYSVLLAIAVGVATGTALGAIVAELLAISWLIGHVLAWWLPYLGHSAESQREAYRREYSRTLKILPTEGHDVVVDVQHMVVGLLTLPIVAFVTLHAVAVL